MGQSTNGQICFGVIFEEGDEFPWDSETFDYDIEIWWRDLKDYKDTCFPYAETESGYAEGFERGDPRISEMLDTRRAWFKENPLPVEVVNYCSGDCPMYILAIPSSTKSANRGYPIELNTGGFDVDVKELAAFSEFMRAHFGGCPVPQLYLSSYWG